MGLHCPQMFLAHRHVALIKSHVPIQMIKAQTTTKHNKQQDNKTTNLKSHISYFHDIGAMLLYGIDVLYSKWLHCF